VYFVPSVVKVLTTTSQKKYLNHMDYVFRSACIVLGVISHLERERELGAVRQLNYAAVSMSTVI